MAPWLALDTGSPIVSVAAGEPGRFDVLSAPQGRSSRELIAMIDELLTRAGMAPHDLSGIGAARGPGSFTGLRVGLATALGLHQATGVRAGALSTFEILGAHYFRHAGSATEVIAVIDALRERFHAQPMRRDGNGGVEVAGPPELRDLDDLVHGRLPLVGHGVSRFPGPPAGSKEASELAPALLRLMADGALSWEGRTLTEPLYLRQPAASPSTRPPGAPRPNRRRRRARGST